MNQEEKEAYESFKRVCETEEEAMKLLEYAKQLAKVGEVTRNTGIQIGESMKGILKRVK